jgi:hypothetical protein
VLFGRCLLADIAFQALYIHFNRTAYWRHRVSDSLIRKRPKAIDESTGGGGGGGIGERACAPALFCTYRRLWVKTGRRQFPYLGRFRITQIGGGGGGPEAVHLKYGKGE